MTEPKTLSRRERQIMDIVFARGQATVAEVQDGLEDPPTRMAIRRTMQILEEKGHLKRVSEGREVVYTSTVSRRAVGKSAFDNVLRTFFGGSLEEAVAAHLVSKKNALSRDEKARLLGLIEAAREVDANSERKP